MRSFGSEVIWRSVVVSAVLMAGVTGCHKSPQPGVVAVSDNGPDPADANMAPVSDVSGAGQQMYTSAPGSTRLLDSNGRPLSGGMTNASQQQAQEYAQNGAPIERRTPQDQGYANVDHGYAADQDSGQWSDGEQDAYNQVTEEATAPPPPLPEYDQPPAPAPNYLWTPGYWSYAPAGYYWVPGAWIAAPFYGALWTPGYWGAWNHGYGYHPGYWGRHIGFYGGVAYGFGYYGTGYHGGYWNGNNFYYNQAVNRVNVANIPYRYNRSVVVNNRVINNTMGNDRGVGLNRASYNGGAGGIQARPQPAEVAAFRGPRIPAMTAQLQNRRSAAENREQFFNQNHGNPVIAAAPRPFAADRGIAAPAERPSNNGNRVGQVPLAQQQGVRPGQAGPQNQIRQGSGQQRAQQMQPQQQRLQQEQQRNLQVQAQQRNAQTQNVQAQGQPRVQQGGTAQIQQKQRVQAEQQRPQQAEQIRQQREVQQNQLRGQPQPQQQRTVPQPQQRPVQQQPLRSAPREQQRVQQPQQRAVPQQGHGQPAPRQESRPAPQAQGEHRDGGRSH